MKVLAVILLVASAAVLGHARPAPELEHDPMERQVSSPKASQTVLEALRNVFKTVWPYLPLSALLLIIIASVAVRFYQKRKWQADFLHEDLDSVGVKNIEVVI
ncbi:hypothetical protein E2C01_011162 [Portunus trituberculatus]|uniref:Uncharacterized protein n=1 Tax=Portunus trituberculatus TaxID=210409 RepID=A0A5B7DAN5_PORTR|nr:hypothetical protein [Portunus trituberculatus]